MNTTARTRLSRLGRVVALDVRPCGSWVTVDATIATAGRVTSVHAVGPSLDAALTAVGA
mgnify:CR=1 FL=1